jgi:hypothetical protein
MIGNIINEASAIENKIAYELLIEIQKLTTAHYIEHLFNPTILKITSILKIQKRSILYVFKF